MFSGSSVQAAALSARSRIDRLQTTKALVVGCGAKQFSFLEALFMQSGSTFARPLLKGEERGAGIALENEPVKNERRRVKMSERTFEVFAHFVNASFSSRVMEMGRERTRSEFLHH